MTKAYTSVFETGKVNKILTDCWISQAYDHCEGGRHPPLEKVTALWDTGATCSCVVEKLAAQMRLTQQGIATLRHASGLATVGIYSANIILPNRQAFAEICLVGCHIETAGVIIGMDIIKLCDLAISAGNGKTNFSFQFPSTRIIDFVKENAQAKK